MKKITILLALLFIVGGSFAQKGKKEIIYLKNGSVLKGQKVRIDDNKIAVHSGKNILVFKDSDIDTIASKWQRMPFEYVSKLYYFKTTMGLLAGGSENAKSTPFSFDASFNYNVYSNLYLGAGLGVDLLEESYMPAFLNLDYLFRESRFTPYIGMQVGYMVPLDERVRTQTYYDLVPWMSYRPVYYQESLDTKGGIMLNPSFGFVNQINQNLGFSLAFGYRFHKLGFEGNDDYELERKYNRLSVRLGIIFN